jgi:hypothetical protein
MADDLDQMLQGAEEQSPASPAQTGAQPEPVALETPEKVEFDSLSGSTQDRIRELIKQKNDALAAAQAPAYVPPAPLTPNNPEVQDAVRKLSEVGIATDDKVNQVVDQKLNVIRWEQEMNRLQNQYSGEGNSPQFDRTEVEDYIRTHPQFLNYAPEDVFKFKMHEPSEFGEKTTKRTTTLRPTKTAQPQEAMTVEFIADRTDASKYEDAREWQEEHKAEIDKVLKTMS